MFQEPFSALSVAVLDRVPVQPLIDRSELFVGKSRTEYLMTGEIEKVRSYSALAGKSWLLPSKSPKPDVLGCPLAAEPKH